MARKASTSSGATGLAGAGAGGVFGSGVWASRPGPSATGAPRLKPTIRAPPSRRNSRRVRSRVATSGSLGQERGGPLDGAQDALVGAAPAEVLGEGLSDRGSGAWAEGWGSGDPRIAPGHDGRKRHRPTRARFHARGRAPGSAARRWEARDSRATIRAAARAGAEPA